MKLRQEFKMNILNSSFSIFNNWNDFIKIINKFNYNKFNKHKKATTIYQKVI